MATALHVALSGASGFVGGHILPKLLIAGHRVSVLVRRAAGFEPQVANARLSIVEGTPFDNEALKALVDGVDAVIHLVGIIRQLPNRGQTFQRIHVEGTKRLLAAAREAGAKRWIHMSALGSRPNAASTYHRTKWDAEIAVRQSGLRYTIFRPSIIHGPDGEFMEMVKGFWCRWLPPFVPYFGAGPFGSGGAGRLQPVWVEDVAWYFTDALVNEKSVGETYAVGGPDVFTWPQLYETCRKHLPKARNKKVRAVPVWYARLIAGKPLVPFNKDQVIMSQEDSVCDMGKLRCDYGFEPAPFESTFAQYASRIR